MGEEAKKKDEGEKEGEATVAVELEKKEDTAPKSEDGKKDDSTAGGGDGEKKEDDGEKKGGDAPPPPPDEIVIRVFMHCEGCAKKVKRSLKGFDGVEDVITDCKTHKVAVKGKKAAEDPLKVVARVQKKTGRKVELLTPLPPPKPEKKEEEKEEEKPKPPEEKKPEPQAITVTLKVYMHCEACAQEIKKRILKMEGVQSVEPDLKASEVKVKGVFDAAKLVEYVYKRTGKHAAVVKQEPVEKAEDEKKADGAAKDEKADSASKDEKRDNGDDRAAKDEKGGGGGEEVSEQTTVAAAKVAELMRNYYYPRYGSGYAYPPPVNAYPMTMPYAYPSHNAYPMSMTMPPPQYAPQLFSDENPNACSVM